MAQYCDQIHVHLLKLLMSYLSHQNGSVQAPPPRLCHANLRHLYLLRTIASHLSKRSCEVTFLTGSEYKLAISSSGTIFIPLNGLADTVETFSKCIQGSAQ